MRLTALDSHWVGAGGEGIHDKDGNPIPARHGVGLSFECPCGCDQRVFVKFSNPLDGGPPHGEGPHWERTGETFDTITVTPSIQRMGGCGWHGFVKSGEVTP